MTILALRPLKALTFGVSLWLCHGAALAQTNPPPPLSEAERELVFGAWQHTVGIYSYDYRLTVFDTEQKARMAKLSKWDGTRYKAYDLRADGLVDVDPALRVALGQLHTPKLRSEPVKWVRKSGAVHWAVLELVKRDKTRPPSDAADSAAKAARWVAQGMLPPPADLATGLEHRSRVAFWRANTPAAVQAVPADLTPNVLYGNAMTPLTQALLRSDMAVAQALIARGADANQCGFWGCPLHLAAGMSEAELGDRATAILLGASAKPNHVDAAYAAAKSVPLNEAARSGRAALVTRLLDAGASPDGAPEVELVPVAAAVLTGRRDIVQLLIDRGASVLPHTDRGRDNIGRPYTLVRAAQEGKDKGLAAWAEELMMVAAERSPRHRWAAHIEQDGKRQALVDGAELSLRAAPFKLVLALPDGGEQGVVLAASFSSALGDEVRKKELRNGIFVPTRSGALPEPPSEDSYELFFYETRPAQPKADENWGGNMSLSVNPQRKDFHEIRAGKSEYVREIRSILEVTEGNAPFKTTALAALKGRKFTLVLGSPLAVEEWTSRLVSPKVVTISLK